MPYKHPMNKEDYWKQVKKSLQKESMTFPTLVLLSSNDSIREVFLENNVLKDESGQTYDLKSLTLPDLDGFKVITDKKDLMEAFQNAQLFVFKPRT